MFALLSEFKQLQSIELRLEKLWNVEDLSLPLLKCFTLKKSMKGTQMNFNNNVPNDFSFQSMKLLQEIHLGTESYSLRETNT